MQLNNLKHSFFKLVPQFEDISDEMIALRHERSEKEENKRFMNYVTLPYHSRIRHNRRTDSRMDSGANTPGKKYL